MKKRMGALLLTLLLALGFSLGGWLPSTSADGGSAFTQELTAKKRKKTPTPAPAASPSPAPASQAGPTASPIPDGPIIEPQAIADWLFSHDGQLPDNFITKREAQNLGWDSSWNYVSDVAPGCSIGGDRYGNYERLLPTAPGRQYYECDCYYTGGRRNGYRLVFSNDGLVFYTEDHYKTFTEMHPWTETP